MTKKRKGICIQSLNNIENYCFYLKILDSTHRLHYEDKSQDKTINNTVFEKEVTHTTEKNKLDEIQKILLSREVN